MAFDFGRETRTLEELEVKLESVQANEQEKSFVRHYAVTGDQFFSFANAYAGKDQETIRKGSYAVIQKKSIRELISWFLKKTPKEIFLEELERACRSRKLTPTRLKLFELRAATEFGVDLKALRAEAARSTEVQSNLDAAAARTKRYEVGDIIPYSHQKVRVTQIDEYGQPIEGEPIELVNS